MLNKGNPISFPRNVDTIPDPDPTSRLTSGLQRNILNTIDLCYMHLFPISKTIIVTGSVLLHIKQKFVKSNQCEASPSLNRSSLLSHRYKIRR